MQGTQAQRNEFALQNAKAARPAHLRSTGNKYNPDKPSKFVKVTPAPIWSGKKDEKLAQRQKKKLAKIAKRAVHDLEIAEKLGLAA